VKPGPCAVRAVLPDAAIAKGALEKAIQKLPIKARIITREEAY
jgi:large subunit ribosomal protein L16